MFLPPQIDTDKKILYVDNSIISTFRACKEKCRLGYVKGYRSKIRKASLDFGHAFHAANERYYNELANPTEALVYLTPNEYAELAFINDLKELGATLPISIDSEEKRSVERGINLLRAYRTKWAKEPFENIVNPATGKPYVEVGFSIYLFDWNGYTIMYVGRMDRIMKSKIDGKAWIIETKTTAQGLTYYVLQVRPNHQLTSYYMAATELGLDVGGCIWDAIFVSNRKPDFKKGGWFEFGIDIDNDFLRHPTMRSKTDIEEFMFDLKTDIYDYLLWLNKDTKRWPRNTGECHSYGGCQFNASIGSVCGTNLNERILESNYVVEPWLPWKGITD